MELIKTVHFDDGDGQSFCGFRGMSSRLDMRPRWVDCKKCLRKIKKNSDGDTMQYKTKEDEAMAELFVLAVATLRECEYVNGDGKSRAGGYLWAAARDAIAGAEALGWRLKTIDGKEYAVKEPAG